MSISLCIVARNEALLIRECIESALPVVDEVILVDTGSTDATRDIGRKAGARVIDAPWPGDLARAHALPIAHANGDWVLSLDGDEILDPASRNEIRSLVQSPDHEGYDFTIRNYLYDPTSKWRWADPCDPLVKGALGYCPNMAVRLFRRRGEFEYTGRLHQSVAASIVAQGGKIGTADVPIHHYGHIRFDRSKSSLYAALARRQVAAEPGSARAWIDLGIVLLQNIQWPAAAAAAAFHQALLLGERPTASFFLAQTLIEMRHSAAAIPYLNDAVRGNPRDELIFFDRSDAWELLGIAHELTGAPDAAEDAYLTALGLKPDSPVALNNLAGLLGERGASREATLTARRLIERCPGLDMPWATLGTIRLHSGKLQAARRALETALEIDPENLPARVNLAVAYERSGQPRKAERAYAKARERSDSPEAWSRGLAEHLPPERGSRSIRLRALGAGAVVSLIGQLAGGGGRVLVDAVHALRGRPQLVLCSDSGAYTGQELRAELDAAGVEVCNVSTESGLRRVLEQVRPDAVINHSGWFPNPVRTGVERWIAVGHSALPMPFGYDAYVAISEFHAQFQRHLPPERLVRIPNGVHLKNFGRRRRPAGQPVTIVMLSRLAPGKFPRRLLDYVFPLAGLDARVLVAGYGRRRFEIEPEISRRGLEKIVSFIGPIPTAQVPRFLGEADIGLHLTETHEELCSMTILEMMASGLPIVAEPKGSLPEMIGHGSNGFLTMDENRIAGYLEDLIASPELRRRMGEASKGIAERYDFARFRASLLDLVETMSRSKVQLTEATASTGRTGRSVRRAPHTVARSGRPRMEKWRPTISYLVCASPRSGSNLLCESLTNTGFAGWPDEFFCRLADRWSLPECGETTDLEEYLSWLFEDRSTPNAVFGAKIMGDHFVELCAQLRKLPGRSALSSHACLKSVFPGLRYVWMTRRDKLRQAISRVRAEQTGQWRQHDGDLVFRVGEPRFSRKEIARRLEEIELQEAGWQTFFTESGARPVVVVYEDLVGSYEATARRVARELGIALPRKVWFGERRLLSQSDARTDQWVRRFSRQQADARELPSVQAHPSRTSPAASRRLPRSNTDSASLPDANSSESKLDLDDVTFLIPVHPDSPHRESNLRLTVAYLSKHFSTRIVVGEQGESRMANALRDLRSGFEEFSFASSEPRFHRTLLLNRMLAFVSTPFVANYDCDVLFPLRQYLNAASMLRAGEADFVFPYDGRCYDVPEPAQDDLLATLPWRDRQVESFRNMIPGGVAVGGGFLARTDVYRACGGENQFFVGWGWEDRERVARFERLGGRIRRVPGDCFHLQHPPAEQASDRQEQIAANHGEFERIAALTPRQLRAEIAGWPQVRSWQGTPLFETVSER